MEGLVGVLCGGWGSLLVGVVGLSCGEGGGKAKREKGRGGRKGGKGEGVLLSRVFGLRNSA